MLHRTFDPARLHAIVNHPSVLPHVSGAIEGPLDLSPLVTNPANITLVDEHGAILFHRHQAGLYEVHTQVLKEGRGPWALTFAKECLTWLFCRSEALEVITRVPKGNYPALVLAKAVGMKPAMTVKDGWKTKEGHVDAHILRLSIFDWIEAAPLAVTDRGKWVRNQWKGSPLIDDDAVLGAAFEMMLHGQSTKAAIFMKRWAAMAGKNIEIEQMSANPVRFRIGDAIVVARGEKNLKVI